MLYPTTLINLFLIDVVGPEADNHKADLSYNHFIDALSTNYLLTNGLGVQDVVNYVSSSFLTFKLIMRHLHFNTRSFDLWIGSEGL